VLDRNGCPSLLTPEQAAPLAPLPADNHVRTVDLGDLGDYRVIGWQAPSGETSVNGLRRNIREANAGIAAAVALGGTMIVPDSAVSMSFNLATYRGQQGFAGSVVGRLSQRIYVNAGVAGSTMRGSTTGRVGISFGL